MNPDGHGLSHLFKGMNFGDRQPEYQNGTRDASSHSAMQGQRPVDLGSVPSVTELETTSRLRGHDQKNPQVPNHT